MQGHLWEIEDNDFVARHSVSQTFRQFYAANERRNKLRAKWAAFFRGANSADDRKSASEKGDGGGFDAVSVHALTPVWHLNRNVGK